jgi:ribosomal protein S18 acetylase RimI-like enzyme
MQGARWYVGRIDGRIVATALGLTAGGATGIFNVATKPEHRRRGYGSALTLRAARDGFADGAELAYLQSTPDGHVVYRRLGFREVDEYVVLSRPQPD